MVANKVSSLPRPPLVPVLCRVPRCRIRIVPACTSCPPKRFTPSRCPCESRPFTEDPPPFLCAISVPWNSLEFDVADLHGRVVLPVAAGNLVLLGLAVLENGQLRPASLTDDFAGDRGLRGACAGDELLFAGMHRENVVEGHLRADLAGQPLYPHRVARRDPVLFVSTANDGVHCASESSVKLLIINSSLRSVNAFG